MSKRNTQKRRRTHEILLQGRLHMVGEGHGVCAACSTRGERNAATWELRVYQNAPRTRDLLRQGIDERTINDQMWEEACQEQATVGVRCHEVVFLCSACAEQMVIMHVGTKVSALAFSMTAVAGKALLLATRRQDEQAAVIPLFPAEVQEKDMLRIVAATPTFHIRPQGEPL